MEAIIFFQKNRGLGAPRVEPVGMKSYLLVRVSLNVEAERWFGRSLRKPVWEGFAGKNIPQKAPEGKDAGRKDTAGKRPGHRASARERLRHPFKARRQRREYLAALQQEGERRLQVCRNYLLALEDWQQKMEQTGLELCRLQKEILELVGGYEEISAVYEDSVVAVLRQPGQRASETGLPAQNLSDLWGQYFPLRDFDGYGKEFWSLHLLPDKLPAHFVVLGASGEIFPLLVQCAPRMRNLRWFLPREDCKRRLGEFVEAFYEEYGLVIELHPLEAGNQLQRAWLVCPESTCILDFSGEKYLPGLDAAEGSIWLDMYSGEEKQRKLEARCPHITYFSLKKTWKRAQKRCNCPVLP